MRFHIKVFHVTCPPDVDILSQKGRMDPWGTSKIDEAMSFLKGKRTGRFGFSNWTNPTATTSSESQTCLSLCKFSAGAGHGGWMDQVAGARGERAERREAASSSSFSSSASDGYKLLDDRVSIHQIMGGGKAVDVLLWRKRRVSFGLIIVSTVAWIVFEQSGISSLTLCSDVLLIIIVILFLRASFASFRNRQLQVIPELVLSEEMVNSTAASLRVKINYLLLLAHDITLGKDFRLFFKVVVCLWLFSIVGSYLSFFTVAYIGTIVPITVPALYSRFQKPVDKCCGVLHNQLSKHCKVVHDNVMGRIPKGVPKDKDT